MSDSPVPRAADGRVAGRRGRATRARLLEATRDVIAAVPFREVTVVDISRRAETSAATFYQYFPGIDAALLALLDDLADEGGRELRALVDGPAWDGPDAADALAAGFVAFFARHGNLLRVVDLATLEGDDRFRVLRTRLFNGVYLALHDLLHEARAAGQIPAGVSVDGVAGVLTTMLAHVSAHQSGFEAWGIGPASLSRSMAEIVDWSIRGVDRRATEP